MPFNDDLINAAYKKSRQLPAFDFNELRELRFEFRTTTVGSFVTKFSFDTQ